MDVGSKLPSPEPITTTVESTLDVAMDMDLPPAAILFEPEHEATCSSTANGDHLVTLSIQPPALPKSDCCQSSHPATASQPTCQQVLPSIDADSLPAPESAPTPTDKLSFVKKKKSLSRLGQSSILDMKSSCDSLVRFQQVSNCNFLGDFPVPEIFSEIDNKAKCPPNSKSKFSPPLSVMEKITFDPPKNCNSNISTVNKPNINSQKESPKLNSLPLLQTQQPTTSPARTFAQATAPQPIRASIPAKGSTPDCGMMVERIKGSTFDEYARAIEIVSGRKSIVFIGQSPGKPDYVTAFLSSPELVEKVVSVGLTIKGRWLCATHLSQPAVKLIISDVYPYISDEVILKACGNFGKPIYKNLRRIPSSTRSREYKHLLSFRRELLITVDDNKQIPESITVYSHERIHILPISTPGLTCHNCKITGHKASACKLPRQYMSVQSVNNDEKKIGSPIPVQDEPKDSKKHDPLGMRDTSWMNPHQKLFNNNTSAESSTPTKESFGTPPANKDFLLYPETQSGSQSQQYPDKVTTSSNQEWKTASKGKKKKKTTATSVEDTKPPAQPRKTPKLGDFSDITSSKLYTRSVDSSILSDGSTDDETKDGSSSFAAIMSGKRRLKDTRRSGQSVLITSDNTKKKELAKEESKPSHALVIDQLRLVIAEIRAKNPKHLQENINSAQTIIEELLTSIWSLRSANRRIALTALRNKYPDIIQKIDFMLSLMPQNTHITPSYKSLYNAKQDIKSLSQPDGRKSRSFKT